MRNDALRKGLLNADADLFSVERQMEASVRTLFAAYSSAFSPAAKAALGSASSSNHRLGRLGMLDRRSPGALGGVLTTRVPAIRDKLTLAHPLLRAWIPGPPWPPDPEAMVADLPCPSGDDDIRLTTLRRWRYLLSVDADPGKLLVGNHAYDADFSSEGLLERCHQVTLADAVKLLVAFERIDPALLAAFWRRDVTAAKSLLDLHREAIAQVTPSTLLPSMSREELPKDTRERVKAAFGALWEYERGSEVLRALLAPGWLDESAIRTQLASSKDLWTAFGDDTRFSRLSVDGWLWKYALDELAESGPGAYHARSPYRTYALGGDPTGTHHHQAHVHIRGFETLDEVYRKTPPALLDKTLQRLDNLALAHFFWGWSGIDVAFALPRMIAASMASRSGRPAGSRTGEALSQGARSAFGRLSVIILSNICPAAAEAQMWAANMSPEIYGLGSLILSERRWPRQRPFTRVQSRSLALGKSVFANPVRDAERGLYAVVPEYPALGWSLGFAPDAWWQDQPERRALHDAFQQHRPGNRYDLGKLFAEKSGPLYDVALMTAVNNFAGLTPMSQDPVNRVRRNERLSSPPPGAATVTPSVVATAPPSGSKRPLQRQAARVQQRRNKPTVVHNKARQQAKKKQRARAAEAIGKRARRRQRK